MGQRVIAIISDIPQESGNHIIDFISLETGKVIDTVCIDKFYDNSCIETKEIPVGDPVILFDNIRLIHKRNVSSLKSEIGKSIYEMTISYYTDEKCTIPANIQSLKEHENRDLVIIDVDLFKQIKDSQHPDDEFMTINIVKTTVSTIERTTVYVQDNDEFYHYFKNKFDIELPFFTRRKMHLDDLIKIIAEKSEYEVINILHY